MIIPGGGGGTTVFPPTGGTGGGQQPPQIIILPVPIGGGSGGGGFFPGNGGGGGGGSIGGLCTDTASNCANYLSCCSMSNYQMWVAFFSLYLLNFSVTFLFCFLSTGVWWLIAGLRADTVITTITIIIMASDNPKAYSWDICYINFSFYNLVYFCLHQSLIRNKIYFQVHNIVYTDLQVTLDTAFISIIYIQLFIHFMIVGRFCLLYPS